MEESIYLRLVAIFTSMVFGFLGVYIPLYAGNFISPEQMKSHFGFSVLRVFSSGVMIGVAFIHLLSDASDSLSRLLPHYKVFAFTLGTMGIVFVLGLEQLVLSLMNTRSIVDSTHDDDNYHSYDDLENYVNINSSNSFMSEECMIENGKIEPPSIPKSPDGIFIRTSAKVNSERSNIGSNRGVNNSYSTVPSSIIHSTVPTILAPTSSHSHSALHLVSIPHALPVLLKAYLTEVAIAIHSIIIGISLGVMGPSDVSTIRALIIAIAFHQFFEGIGLGAIISCVRAQLGPCKVQLFAVIFSITLPLGIAVGILISAHQSQESETHVFTTGCANALASGTLIYIALVEVLAEEFSPHDPVTANLRPLQRLAMVLAFASGIAIMAILAIWA